MSLFDAYPHDKEGLERRTNEILQGLNDMPESDNLLLEILGLTDLTSLNATDNDDSISRLCNKAISLKYNGRSVYPAAVCIYSPFINTVKSKISGSPVRIASVGGLFPSGKGPLKLKKSELQYILDQGADEIDVVIDRGKIFAGREDEVFEEIKIFRELCGDKILKVILETGELQSVNNIRMASETAILAGADFIKTSTGKIIPGATMTAMLIMLDTIGEYYQKTGKRVGIKPAGGIPDAATALRYYFLVKNTLGKEWLSEKYFRIGASRLWDHISDHLMTL